MVQRRRTVALLLALGLAPLAAAGAIAAALGGGAIVAQVNSRVEAAGRQAAGILDRAIAAKLTSLGGVADDLAVLAAAEHAAGASTAAASGALDGLASADPEIGGVALTDASGAPVTEAGPQDPLIGLPLGWERRLLHGGSLSAAAASVAGEPPQVTVALAVLRGGGTAGGYLVERDDFSRPAAEISSLASAQGMTIEVLADEGTVLMGSSAPSPGAVPSQVPAAGRPAAAPTAQALQALRSRTVQVGDSGGTPWAMTPLTEADWVVASSLPASSLDGVTELDLALLGTCGGLGLLFLGGVAAIDAGLRRQERVEADLIAETAMMAHAAMHDPLTGLPNRILFNDRLQHGISNARRSGRGVALFVIDLDGFKALNDSLGHAVGDALLRETASRLQASVRASDTVARLGGDEFAIVAVDADRADADLIQAKIRQRMDDPIAVEDGQVSVRLSIGLAVFPEDGSESAVLLRRADIDMYRDKRSRKAGSG
jgi:diguanylate cyclase (GGDEF)-like protein